jgi:diadenosine tetraphosphatase ApaH/serine/threonine PP2A family protein phosphatase
MRALILSDIHANLEALEAVLAAAPAYDVAWNLGDVVGYGANPNEVIDRARGIGSVFVRGNHDRVSAGMPGIEDFNPIASRAVRWTQSVLSEEHTAWLRKLAAGPIMPDGPEVSCMHGSPSDEDRYLVTMRDAFLPMREIPTRINFFGHTHLQGGFATNGDEWFRLDPAYATRDEAEEYELQLRDGGRYLINPGSVGQPRDHDWRAAFAVYDDQARTVSFYRVPYDVRQAQARILRAGLPDRLATRLREGR